MTKKIEKSIFYIFIFLLPICSVSYFSGFIHQWYINASALPGIIGITFMIINMRKNFKYIFLNETKTVLILVGYLINVSIINSIIVEKTDTLNGVYGLITIFIIILYVVSNINQLDIKYVIKIMLTSMMIVVIYGYVQLLAYRYQGSIIYSIYKFVSSKIDYIWGVSPTVQYVINSFGRINLTTPEASEATAILSIILMPFLMGTVLTGITVFRRKLFNIIVKEYIILGITIPLMLMILSSTGYIVFTSQLTFLLIIYLFKKKQPQQSLQKKMIILTSFASIILFLILIMSNFKFNEINEILEVARTWTFKVGDFNNISTSTRIGLMVLGMNVFLKNPIFGVGLFNVGGFFERDMPSWAYNDEINRYISSGRWFIGPRNVNFINAGGIIGVILLLLIIINIYRRFDRYKSEFSNYIKYSYIFYIVATFFQGFNSSHIWFLYIWVIPSIFIGYKEKSEL